MTTSGPEAYLATFALRGSEVYLVICLISLVSTPMRVPFLNTTWIADDKMNLMTSGSEAYLATFALRGSEVYLVICLLSLVSTPMRVPFFNIT